MGPRPRVAERRTYGQREPVAAALDLVGDRWSLLIIRELVLGPQRWSDLVANLPGIGKNLLAQRLRELSTAGVVTAGQLPWSSRVRLYGLTDSGRSLEPVVYALARFGLSRVPRDGASRAAWAALALAAATEGTGRAVRHVTIDDAPFTIASGAGGVSVRRGLHGRATSVETLPIDRALRAASRTST